MKIKNIEQVVSWRLCVGCGACAYICKNKYIELRDVPDQGMRPFVSSNQCGTCTDCLQVCPGYSTPGFFINDSSQISESLEKGWGPIIEIWEGYASDSEVRYNGSSGGAASAIALYCLEIKSMSGVLHIGRDEENPLKNNVFMSTNRADLLSRTGSQYSPASPCSGLDEIASAPSSCVFIGKPCDVAGLQKACQLRSDLNNKNGLSIGIFCAGTPSSRGTLELLKKMKISHDLVKDVRYRGIGWPGMFTVNLKDNKSSSLKIPYMEAWGFLQKYRPYRCYLCPDGTAAHADISCGDPWYRTPQEGDLGYSLVMVRTEKGKRILQGAIDAGYLSMKRIDIQKLIDSQEGLLKKRKEIWGRLLAMRMFGLPIPQYPGFFLFEQWLSSSVKQKARSLLGTALRIIQRKYYLPARTDS
jgi:coenzyme F420 hydrogenase subunit beta